MRASDKVKSAPISFVPAITLAVICLVCALLLAGTYELTRDAISEQEAQAAKNRMIAIFPDGNQFKEVRIEEDLKAQLISNGCACEEIHEALDSDGNRMGYIIVSRSFGYAGDIIVTSGFLPDGSIVHVIVTAPDETPKLGKEVEEKYFTDRFSGVSAGDHAENCVDMISGATISSKAVCTAFNKAVETFRTLSEKGVIGS